MKQFDISDLFINAIKNQALKSKNEIYGWLIGYRHQDVTRILAIIECSRFENQSFISAAPLAQEFYEMSSYMPQGIGPVGIYHSHPFSSEIFHSHVDDSTLISLSNQFPNCVSVVTNGLEVNYYQMGKNKATEEIEVNFIEPEIPKFLLISMNEKLIVKVDKDIVNDENQGQKLKINLLNSVRNYFEKIWNDLELYYGKKTIFKENSIKEYLVDNINADISVQIHVPAIIKDLEKNIITIEKDTSTNAINNYKYDSYSLNIKVKIPIYIAENNFKLRDIDQSIKTELISNNILQKIYNCVINDNEKEITIQDDYYLKFFGFYIRLMRFNDPSLNKNDLSLKAYNVILKLISLFDHVRDLKIAEKKKIQIQEFIQNVKDFSISFEWFDIIKKKLKKIEKKFNF